VSSCLYTGFVSHRRTRPLTHAFRYPLALFYLDLDELPDLDRRLRLFAVNRGNVLSFHDRDHMDRQAGNTKAKIRAFLERHGVGVAGGRIRLLTQCRMLHYVFNPVSFYFCHADDGGLHSVVAEVNNTFGERHLYLLSDRERVPAPSEDRMSYQARKVMHVSPFVSMDATYRFHFAPVGDRLSIRLSESEHGQPFFDAHLWGRRRELTDRNLAALLLRYPLLTARVIAAIHWQALRLYLKGAPFYAQPPASPPQREQLELISQLRKEATR